MLLLAETYLARSSSGFSAYMRLQQALLARYMARGGTPEAWCERMAPVFRLRYGGLVEEALRLHVGRRLPADG
jgi:hypothetical protein